MGNEMMKYQVLFDGELDDEIFESYIEAKEYAIDCCKAVCAGVELLHMLNPGEYPDETSTVEYEILKISEWRNKCLRHVIKK